MELTTSLKIFVVDDDKLCLNIYEQHLLNLGYTDVETFDNGTSCLNNLIRQAEVIFLDLPLLTGDEPVNSGCVAAAQSPWPGMRCGSRSASSIINGRVRGGNSVPRARNTGVRIR